MLVKPGRLKKIHFQCLALLLISTTILCMYLKLLRYVEEPVVVVKWTKPTATMTTTKTYEKRLQEYERQMVSYLGRFGQPAFLTKDEAVKGDLSVKTYMFNTVLSDRIPLTRKLRDPRSKYCETPKNTTLTASIIIVFSNALLSVLLRSIWSFVLRSPSENLKEIILLDNASTDENLKELLPYYLETRMINYTVQLHRFEHKKTAVDAKLAGAKLATGNVLVFMDAYCEVTDKWMEPLLDRIEENRKSVVVPIIDTIDGRTFGYVAYPENRGFQMGDFYWSGYSRWTYNRSVHPKDVRHPIPTPVIAGGLFAIEKRYFWEIGAYDDQMKGWGGENLELSFRVWQCGGRLETVACSRVGHIFAEVLPKYQPTNDRTTTTHHLNVARTAHVWMDHYKKLFFMFYPELEVASNTPDLKRWKKLRDDLKCRSFQWYLRNVHPRKFVPFEKAFAFGQIRNKFNVCLDDVQKAGAVRLLGVYACHRGDAVSQSFSITFDGTLRNEYKCAETFNRTLVKLATCVERKKKQRWWFFVNGTIYHPYSNRCLSSAGVRAGDGVKVDRCMESAHQKWFVTHVNTTALMSTERSTKKKNST